MLAKRKIKICGITRKDEIIGINKLQVDYVGFIFAPSKRQLSPFQARELIKLLNPRIKAVGVFVNENIDKVNEIVDYCNLDIVQLHGDETNDDCLKVSRPVWKSIAIKDRVSADRYKDYPQADGILLDTFVPGLAGGSGKTFDWEIVKDIPEDRIILAGGLTPNNSDNALEKINAPIVDVSTGVETKGLKDMKKIKEFIRSVKAMDRKFGEFGGQYVPETLMNPLIDLEENFNKYCFTSEFKNEFAEYLKEYVGRPSNLYYAKRLTEKLGGAKIYLKREDLNHTGAHKINNVLGQILLAKHMGKRRVIAETGAGQHGVATATVAALFDMECTVFMGEEDMERQDLNVFRMETLGAKVVGVSSGSRTLKDATNEALREWVRRAEDSFYVVGSVVGPHPYPTIVREFQKIIGEETKKQILARENRLPDYLIACVGGGSNAMGMFYPFLEDENVKMLGVEAGGQGIGSGMHALALAKGKIGILHGMKTYLLQDNDGQIIPAHSISAGLDYPGIGPEHAYLHKIKRVEYLSVTDEEALGAFKELSLVEGIIPALESSHAIAQAIKVAGKLDRDKIIVVNLSGRGDKDIHTVAKLEREMAYE